MHFGVIPNLEWPRDGDPGRQFRRTIEQARTTVESGYDAVWFSQHYVSEGHNRVQVVPALSRVTAFAGDADLGTSVFLLPLHEPIEVAENLATIDAAFGGEFAFGVALGYKPEEFEAFGIEPSDRVGRLVESIELLRRLWTEDEVSFSGEHFELDGIGIDPKPGGGDGLPIWMGGNVEASVRRAGRLGDGWIISARTEYDEARRLSGIYADAVASSDRPSQGIGMNREVFVADTTEEAVETVKPVMKDRARKWIERGAGDTSEQVDDLDAQVEEMLEERFVGSPEEVIDRIAGYRDGVGVDRVICMYNWRDLPHESIVASIERFGDEVIPYFA